MATVAHYQFRQNTPMLLTLLHILIAYPVFLESITLPIYLRPELTCFLTPILFQLKCRCNIYHDSVRRKQNSVSM